MDFETLSMFLRLAKTLHFGQASRACHVSPTALSRRIRQLEETLQITLFERDSRHVKLTSAGLRLSREAGLLMAQWDDVRSSLGTPSPHLSGSLRLFCSPTAAYALLPNPLKRFHNTHPRVAVQLSLGESIRALDMLLDDHADVVIGALPKKPRSVLLSHPLVDEAVVVVAPRIDCEARRLLGESPINWARLPWILPESGQVRKKADAWLRARRTQPRVVAEVGSHEATLALVASGYGLGVLPELTLRVTQLQSKVQVVNEARGKLAPGRICAFVLRRKQQSPAVNAFWQCVTADNPARGAQKG